MKISDFYPLQIRKTHGWEDQLTSENLKRRQGRDSGKEIQSVELVTFHTNDTPVIKNINLSKCLIT